jgi:hypothetical protein
MGMFDNIHYRGREYQTKDTPLQTLDNYKIAQDQYTGHWWLWHEEYDAEWVVGEGLFGGSIKKSNHRWVHCSDFSGDIRFYYYTREEGREEYLATFLEGHMRKIRMLEGEPLTKWILGGLDPEA